MPEQPAPRPTATRRIPVAIGAVLIGAAIGFAGIYGIGGLKRNAAGDSACRPAVALAKKLAPLAQGEVAALTMATDAAEAAGSRLRGRRRQAQKALGLARPHRAGEPVGDLVRALPPGNAGAGRPADASSAGPISQVVAVNIDTRDPDKPRNFLKDANLTRLGYFQRPESQGFSGP